MDWPIAFNVMEMLTRPKGICTTDCSECSGAIWLIPVAPDGIYLNTVSWAHILTHLTGHHRMLGQNYRDKWWILCPIRGKSSTWQFAKYSDRFMISQRRHSKRRAIHLTRLSETSSANPNLLWYQRFDGQENIWWIFQRRIEEETPALSAPMLITKFIWRHEPVDIRKWAKILSL